MITKGTRVRILTNGGIASHDYTGHTGTVIYDGVYNNGKGFAFVNIDKCGMSNCTVKELNLYIEKLEELTTLQEGYKFCSCGSITSKPDGVCCDCRGCELCSGCKYVCQSGIGSILTGCGYNECKSRKPCPQCNKGLR